MSEKQAAATVALITGTATACAVTRARTISRQLRIIPGKAEVVVFAPGAKIASRAAIFSGRAEGFDAIAYDNELITTLAA